MRRVATVLLVALASLIPARAGAATVDRLAGPTRYDTATTVARALHDRADTAVVASGTSFPDALAAGVAAALLDAPLLLASPSSVPVDALRELGVDEVALVGGSAALPDAVGRWITAATGASVTRIAGPDRYATSRAVAAAVAPDADVVVTAPGATFERALVASVHAARLGAPLVLSTAADADEITIGRVSFHGGPMALNRAVLGRFPASDRRAIVTTITSFADALAAAPLAAALDAAVLFTEPASAGATSVELYDAIAPRDVVVVGGTASVPARVLEQLFGWWPLPPTIDHASQARIARDVFERMNGERAARGVAPLVWDQRLADAAAMWARGMSDHGLGNGVVSAGIGENVLQAIPYCDDGCSLPTSGSVHLDWMRSASHRDNVVEPGYLIAGVGVFCDADGTLWAVERFGIGFGSLSGGGSAPAPVVHDDAGGITCEGAPVADQPWWQVAGN